MFEIILKAWKMHNERIEEVRQRESKCIGVIKSCWCPIEEFLDLGLRYKCTCDVSASTGDRFVRYFHHFFNTLCEGGKDYQEGKSTKTCILMSPGERLLYRGWELQCLEAMGHSGKKKLVWSRKTWQFEHLGDVAFTDWKRVNRGVGPWNSKIIKCVDKGEYSHDWYRV